MVREGYKQTEAGVIPEDWNDDSLQDKVELLSGRHILSNKYNSEGTGKPYLTGPADFKDRESLVSKWTEERGIEAEKGDILITVKGSGAGSSFKLDLPKTVISRQLMALKSKKILQEYLFYVIKNKESDLSSKAVGNLIPGLSRSDILTLKILLPSDEEQRSIAQALSDVDALIAALDKAIAKKRAIKTATMQQLLTGKKRLPGFGEGKDYKKSAIGVISEDWEVNSLGELTEYIKGFAFRSSDFQTHGVRVIRVSDTTFDFIKTESEIFIDEKKANIFRKWAMREGDLIISTVGSKPPMYDSMVGKATFVDAKNVGSLLNQNAVIIRSKDWNREAQVFLHNHLKQPRYIDHIEKIFRGNANQASITLKELFEFLIPTPKNREEQHAIATVLSDMDAEIVALETRLAKTQALKQGMMQQLLTGKVRLKIEA